MRWDQVADAVVTALRADSALTTALGVDGSGNIPIYPGSAARPVFYPSVEYVFIWDREYEMQNPMMMQIDYWTRGQSKARTVERRIRRVLHSDVRRTFAGVDCETSFDDARDHDHDEPGIVHRSLDFRFEPVRER